MSVIAEPSAASAGALRHALPDPGERVPTVAWPTVGIFVGALALFAAGTATAIAHSLPVPVSIAINALACFVMFTVVHDAAHYSISTTRWSTTAMAARYQHVTAAVRDDVADRVGVLLWASAATGPDGGN